MTRLLPILILLAALPAAAQTSQYWAGGQCPDSLVRGADDTPRLYCGGSLVGKAAAGGGGGGATLYTADGTVTDHRTALIDSSLFFFYNVGPGAGMAFERSGSVPEWYVFSDGTQLTVNPERISNVADSFQINDHSLAAATPGYVWTLKAATGVGQWAAAGGGTPASNGLSLSGDTVELGGKLTKASTVDVNAQPLEFVDTLYTPFPNIVGTSYWRGDSLGNAFTDQLGQRYFESWRRWSGGGMVYRRGHYSTSGFPNLSFRDGATASGAEFQMVFVGDTIFELQRNTPAGLYLGARQGGASNRVYTRGTRVGLETDSALTRDPSTGEVRQVAQYRQFLGWEQVQDSSLTAAAPQTILAGDTAVIQLRPTSAIRSQLPPGVDSFYDGTNLKFQPVKAFDAYDIRLDFRMQNTSTNGVVEFQLDIGPPVGVIVYRVLTVPKGANTEHKQSIGFSVYAGDTFLANGGQFKITSLNGNTIIYQPILFIKKDYHAR